MKETILAVDDEPLILSAYKRNLGDRFTIVTADGPVQALEALKTQDFAVVLTDLKMPGMDGIEFLKEVRNQHPDVVRILISGHADLSDAISSVNNAGIFRLLLKPCPVEEISSALYAGIVQYRLVTAERALLENTLNGAIQTLMDILAILDGEAFGQAQLRRKLAKEVAQALKAPAWEFEMAALLAEIGRASLPPAINEKIAKRQKLSEVEKKLIERVPEFSYQLLNKIPRIESVAEAVLYQAKNMDGSGYPENSIFSIDIPLAGRVLHAINTLMDLCHQGMPPTDAISTLKLAPGKFDPSVVAVLHVCCTLLDAKPERVRIIGPQNVMLAELIPGMVLLSNVETKEGFIVLGADTELTASQIQRTRNFAQLNPVVEPFLVEIR